jgi:hypothetical protein
LPSLEHLLLELIHERHLFFLLFDHDLLIPVTLAATIIGQVIIGVDIQVIGIHVVFLI